MSETTFDAKRMGALLGLALVVVASLLVTLAAKPAHASLGTLVVNSTADGADASLDGICDADTATPGNQCTLRAAIQEANNSSGLDVIHFFFPGDGVHTISPTSQLPTITDQVIIDGYSQPDSSANTASNGTNARPLIEIDGTNAGKDSSGLIIGGSNSVVKGLIINRFDFIGLQVANDTTGVSIEGNFIGTDSSGTADQGNRVRGVSLNINAVDNTVGGSTPDKRNLISGNGNGILITQLASDNEVSGNLIGTQKDGISPLGNDNDGVLIANGSNNLVGGSSAAAANTIAFSGQDGVNVNGSTAFPANGNRILSNSIFFNGRLGIDLDSDGVTQNDLLDLDGKNSNRLQNFPVIFSAKKGSGRTTIKGKLNSTPGATFTVQLFSNPRGTDQGRTLLGQKSVTTDSNGDASFSFKTRNKGVSSGNAITATATNEATGDTSEFSAPKSVKRA